MAYDQTNPPGCIIDAFSSLMPRIWLYCSTNYGSDISMFPGTTSSSALGVGFFKGAGEHSYGSRGAVGMRVGDVVMNVCSAPLGNSTDGLGGPWPGLVTLHSVVSSTPDGSTINSSVGYDVSVSQASLGG